MTKWFWLPLWAVVEWLGRAMWWVARMVWATLCAIGRVFKVPAKGFLITIGVLGALVAFAVIFS